MRRRNAGPVLRFGLLILAVLLAAGLYAAGRTGILNETAMMLLLLPIMLGIVCLCCLIYAYESASRGGSETNPIDEKTNEVNRNA